MGNILLAVFLILFAICSFTSAIPLWVAGIVGAVAAVLMLTGR